ncbi:putative baseplate assembly protein [Actinopolymorpha alba]|uniref:putative baseplate assembly protein n=1 Tax=Actinopolymorpha alba TaxID=533267 RepID=UPI0003679C07|nr:putative baseplate assembly protein [Actinopolymorpha alba]
MTLPVPDLDDRTFVDLVLEARERIARTCPTWTDLSIHDPGMVLVEVFAHLMEVMLYRLNRVPEKAYVEFLNLLRVPRHPPAAAWADLTFSRNGRAGAAAPKPPIAIPVGTKVRAERDANEPIVFVTTEAGEIPAGQDETTVRAYHCTVVEGELLGIGTGLPGQSLRASKAPLTTTTEPYDLMLGVEIRRGTAGEGAVVREFAGKTFEIWQPVATFAGVEPGARVYLLDRASGTVTFAPALDLRSAGNAGSGVLTTIAAVPPANTEVRLWYRTGGGASGNVAAGVLTRLLDPLPGVRVTNQAPARGGCALESIDSVLARGPAEVLSQQRAVTARDFELLATANAGAVARAKAFTRAAMWSFASPGEVEVVLVPAVDDTARPGWRLPAGVLLDHQVEAARARVEDDLRRRQALGTSCLAAWARCKAVSVIGRVVVRRDEDLAAVRRRLHDRLYEAISPLPTPRNPTGWRFGEPLRASNVYRMLEESEPGVRYVDDVRFVVEDAPDASVRAVAADQFQPETWYAGCGELLCRSTNGGRGWEPVGRFPGEEVRRIVPAPAALRPGMTARAGRVAALTRRQDGTASGVYVSSDLGETWHRVAELEPAITDLAWTDRDATDGLLLATDAGLYELPLLPGSVPLQVLVEPSDPDRGFAAVATFVSERGVPGVAVAAQAQYGVYISTAGGQPGTFVNAGLQGVDIRTLAVQFDGPATLLWVGAGEPDPNRPGPGCFRARLFETGVHWEAVRAGWVGGTCWDVAFAAGRVLAATQSGGVLIADTRSGRLNWQAPDVNCGLPLRDRLRFEPVAAVAAIASSDGAGLVLAGGTRGVHRSDDASRWVAAANRETREVVTIPGTWLLCSGNHDIEVVYHDATPRD